MIDSNIQESIPSIGNFELPISLRKQPRSSTQHLISKFVLYKTLAIGFHAFTSKLDLTKISKNIYEALKMLK